MRLLMMGANHRSADVRTREKLAASDDLALARLASLREAFPAAEAVLLSTCNRTEYYVARPTDASPTIDELREHVARACDVSADELRQITIQRENREAMSHLFHVAAGLDSMVLGEAQILGQVKRAYELGQTCGAVGPVLHKAFQGALASAKRIRTETDIDVGRTSVASVAVDLASQIFERFTDKTVLTVGAGEIAKLMVRRMAALKPERLWIVNRTIERASAMTGSLGLDAAAAAIRPWDQLDESLVDADIVVTSTGSPEPILTAARLKPLMNRRRYRPLFIIDLAMPRDVESAAGGLSGVYLYNVDDLQAVVAQTHDDRSALVDRCRAMTIEAADACLQEIQHRDLGALIRNLREELTTIGSLERERTLRQLRASGRLTDWSAIEAALAEHDRRLVNKVLHMPLTELNRHKGHRMLGFYAAALRRLFGLREHAWRAEDDALGEIGSTDGDPPDLDAPLPRRPGQSTSADGSTLPSQPPISPEPNPASATRAPGPDRAANPAPPAPAWRGRRGDSLEAT